MNRAAINKTKNGVGIAAESVTKRRRRCLSRRLSRCLSKCLSRCLYLSSPFFVVAVFVSIGVIRVEEEEEKEEERQTDRQTDRQRIVFTRKERCGGNNDELPRVLLLSACSYERRKLHLRAGRGGGKDAGVTHHFTVLFGSPLLFFFYCFFFVVVVVMEVSKITPPS